MDARHAKDGGDLGLLTHDTAAAGVQKITPALRIEIPYRGARLHRHAGDTLHPGLQARDMGGAGECGVGPGGIANLGVEKHIRRQVVPNLGRSGLAAAAVSTAAGSTS